MSKNPRKIHIDHRSVRIIYNALILKDCEPVTRPRAATSATVEAYDGQHDNDV